jgi:hypothetical protein
MERNFWYWLVLIVPPSREGDCKHAGDSFAKAFGIVT